MKKIPNLSVVILSGGLATRMKSQPKALIELNGKRLIESTIEQVKLYCNEIIISANNHIPQYKKYGNKVLTDYFDGHLGPLSGIYTALINTKDEYLLVVPCDSPKLPDKLIEKLYQGIVMSDSKISVASDSRHLHPTFCIIHQSLHENLRAYIEAGGRKLSSWLIDNDAVKVMFSDKFPNFFNINSAEDLNYYQQNS